MTALILAGFSIVAALLFITARPDSARHVSEKLVGVDSLPGGNGRAVERRPRTSTRLSHR